MSELTVTLPNGITLPFPQLVRISELGQELGDFEWHPNECGCCVSVHPRGETHHGYIIDREGGYEWVELDE